MREAQVRMLAHGAATATDSYDFDPILVPTVNIPSLGGCLVATDYQPLVELVERLVEEEAERLIVDFVLVWSDTKEPIKASCPRCGNVDDVSGSFLGDTDRRTLVCHDCA